MHGDHLFGAGVFIERNLIELSIDLFDGKCF